MILALSLDLSPPLVLSPENSQTSKRKNISLIDTTYFLWWFVLFIFKKIIVRTNSHFEDCCLKKNLMFTDYKVEDNKDGIETNQNIFKNKVESYQHTFFPHWLLCHPKQILIACMLYFISNIYLFMQLCIFHV